MFNSTVVRRISSLRKLKSIASDANLLKSNSNVPARSSSNRISGIGRLPVETSFLLTMLPLHSVIASARLQSVLSVDSQSWCLVPQGLSMPL